MLLSACLLFGTWTIFYGSFIEPHILVTNEKTIELDGIDTPFTIALIADLQVGPYVQKEDVDDIVMRILSLHPDMVLIAGDHADNSSPGRDETIHLAPLARLIEADIPTYAVPGNHEYGAGISKKTHEPKLLNENISERVAEVMREIGIIYLENGLVTTTIHGQPLAIYGADSYLAGKLSFDGMAGKDPTLPTIGLIHNPAAAWIAAKEDIDLILAGHTHGGQIRLPFIGPVGRLDEAIPTEWYQGHIQVDDDTQLFVTSGAGSTGTRARLFNPPEVVLLRVE